MSWDAAALLRAIYAAPGELPVAILGHSRLRSGWEIRERVLDEHLFYGVMSGGITGRIDDRDVALDRGGTLWLPPGLPHRFINASGGRPLVLYHLRVVLPDPPAPPLRPLLVDHAGPALSRFSELYDGQTGRGDHRDLRLRADLARLVLAVDDARHEHGGPRLSRQQERLVVRLLHGQTVQGRPPPSPAALARAAGLAPAYFARVFRRSFGLPPRTWILHERLRLVATALLDDRRTIAQVAAAHGFADSFLFSRQFRALLGVSPRGWRAQRTAAHPPGEAGPLPRRR